MNEGKWKGKKERQKDEQKKGENVPGKGWRTNMRECQKGHTGWRALHGKTCMYVQLCQVYCQSLYGGDARDGTENRSINLLPLNRIFAELCRPV